MKKLLILSILLLTLTGCKKEKPETISIDVSNYEIKTPYKAKKSSYSVYPYDIKNANKLLTELSKNYFKTNNSYFEEGQYLDNETLKLLLSKDQLNKAEPITFDNITIEPTYISAIIEQNFLATNNVLKGISLGIVLNKYQPYKNTYGTTLYKEVSEEILIEHAKKISKQLLDQIRNNDQLKETKIVIGLYIEDNNLLPGTYKYVGTTNSKTIDFHKTNLHYEKLDNSFVSTNDTKNYNNFIALKEALKEETTFIASKAYYKDNNLLNLELNINVSNFDVSKIQYLSLLVSKNLNLFANNINIKIYIKNNDKLNIYIEKNGDINEVKIHTLEG